MHNACNCMIQNPQNWALVGGGHLHPSHPPSAFAYAYGTFIKSSDSNSRAASVCSSVTPGRRPHSLSHHGRRRIFLGVGKLRDLEFSSPPAGSRGTARVGIWGGGSPGSWWHVLTVMHKYLVYTQSFDITGTKTLYNISRWGKQPSPMPASAHVSRLVSLCVKWKLKRLNIITARPHCLQCRALY